MFKSILQGSEGALLVVQVRGVPGCLRRGWEHGPVRNLSQPWQPPLKPSNGLLLLRVSLQRMKHAAKQPLPASLLSVPVEAIEHALSTGETEAVQLAMVLAGAGTAIRLATSCRHAS